MAHGVSPKIGSYGPFQNLDLSIPSEQAPSKLSEIIKSLNLDHQNYRADSSTFKMKGIDLALNFDERA